MKKPDQKVVFNGAQIRERVEALAEEIAKWLSASGERRLTLLSVLEGARPFTRDLSEALQKTMPGLEIRVQEVRVKATEGTSLLKDRQCLTELPAAKRGEANPLLIVDDLVDSGQTLEFLKKEIERLNPGPVKTAVLIRKYTKAGPPVDFCGFDLGLDPRELAAKGLRDYWLFGYGMDLEGRFRELDHIGWKEIKEGP